MEWLAVVGVAVAFAAGIAPVVRGVLPSGDSMGAVLDRIATGDATPGMAPIPPSLGGGGWLPIVDGASIVRVAQRLAIAGIVEVPPGSNRGPGIDLFTEGNAEAWCADFVSWVLRAAGHPFTGGASGWRLAWTGDVRAWFAARAAFRDRLVADPRPGDVIWFVHGHVGIVESVHGDALTTIEGNAGDAVTRRTYPAWRVDADIGGFGRPGAHGIVT